MVDQRKTFLWQNFLQESEKIITNWSLQQKLQLQIIDQLVVAAAITAADN